MRSEALIGLMVFFRILFNLGLKKEQWGISNRIYDRLEVGRSIGHRLLPGTRSNAKVVNSDDTTFDRVRHIFAPHFFRAYCTG